MRTAETFADLIVWQKSHRLPSSCAGLGICQRNRGTRCSRSESFTPVLQPEGSAIVVAYAAILYSVC